MCHSGFEGGILRYFLLFIVRLQRGKTLGLQKQLLPLHSYHQLLSYRHFFLVNLFNNGTMARDSTNTSTGCLFSGTIGGWAGVSKG